MKRIYKYELGVLEQQQLELPIGAEILRVSDVEGRLFIWVLIMVEENPKLEKVTIEMYKTGQEIENALQLEYLGFCKVFVGMELGLYVFRRIKQ